MHMEKAFPLIQESLTTGIPDDAIISAVFYIMITELCLGEWQKCHNHLKGLAIMLQSAYKAADGRANMILDYTTECAAYLETVIGTLGYPLVIPDEILPTNTRWLTYLEVTPEHEKWVLRDFKHAEFQRQVIRMKLWAESLRKKDPNNEQGSESQIAEQAEKLIQAMKEWQQKYIPPFYEEEVRQARSTDDVEVINSRRFLQYPRYQFESPLHGEIHLLFYTLILTAYYVIEPAPGPTSAGKLDTAIRFCQGLAALGDNPGCRSPASKTSGQFFSRLTFDDSYPEG